MTYLWYIIFAIGFCGIASALIRQPEYASLLAKVRATTKTRSTNVLTDFDISGEYSQQMNNTHLYGLPKCQQCRQIGIIGAGIFLLK
jgi:hypothetical protein